ncbi:NAD-dependent epimerase/dehydratase family protein [Entomomonas moraniae]|uniref:NAD-dependent epimerase/dehydratase family protein n=1 Tax=Entomomonas moraniae TaxID=2213226 RepID=A0A3Q9JMP6_9GAMM|nr:NAD(P)H-binding protein [Entomomonas moraniae]AZS49763.1 NAD-dependent epimerase/dehydratase family protein [Entomomonas moraniae]
MKNILVLGASGSLAKVVITVLLDNPEIKLTLFSRHITELIPLTHERVSVVKGDVMDLAQLEQAMQGQDIVYANLAGELELMAKNVVQAMAKQNIKRLIWISSMGIYDETETDHGSILDPYRLSAKVIEESKLDYTLIRPAWFTNGIEVDYKLTRKGEAFQGDQVSRRSIAALIDKLIQKPDCAIGESLGIAKV